MRASFYAVGSVCHSIFTSLKIKSSENWFVLRNMTYELTRADGSVVRHKREVYDRGNGATVLLYNRHKQTVVPVRQFRVATGSMAIMTAC